MVIYIASFFSFYPINITFLYLLFILLIMFIGYIFHLFLSVVLFYLNQGHLNDTVSSKKINFAVL